MMRSPEGYVLVMLDQQVLHDKQVAVLFGNGQDLDDRCDACLVGVDRETLGAEHRPKRITEAWLCHPGLQALVGKFIILEILEDIFILLSRDKLELAKLHRLKTT